MVVWTMAQITIGVRLGYCLGIAIMLGGTQLLPLDMTVGARLAEIWMPSDPNAPFAASFAPIDPG